MSTIVVVGCGVAGDEAAFAARKTDRDARVIVVTEEPQPLYSPCVLADYVAGDIPRERTMLRPASAYERAGIELRLSCPVTGWEPERGRLHLEDGTLDFERLVLATGSRAAFPPLPGVDLPGVVSLRTLRDADYLRNAEPASAVVVGTGLVGMEAACSLRTRGWDVTLVGRRGRVLPRLFDAPVAEVLRNELETAGVRVLLGEAPREILGTDRAEGIRTDNETVRADLVVFGAGMRPEVTLARQGNLPFGGAGGIGVDDRMGTGQPGVWAAGDCVESRNLLTGETGLYMLWNNARHQGRVAGANAAGGKTRYRGSLNTTTIHVFDRAAASVGTPAAEDPSGEAELVHRRLPGGEVTLVLRRGRVVGAQALGETRWLGYVLGSVLRGADPARELGRTVVRTRWAGALRVFGRDFGGARSSRALSICQNKTTVR